MSTNFKGTLESLKGHGDPFKGVKDAIHNGEQIVPTRQWYGAHLEIKVGDLVVIEGWDTPVVAVELAGPNYFWALHPATEDAYEPHAVKISTQFVLDVIAQEVQAS